MMYHNLNKNENFESMSDNNTNDDEKSEIWLKKIYDAVCANDFQTFIELYENYVNDKNITGYFLDFGGRPASSWYKRVPYELCTCKTDWVRVHRQLDRRACKCKFGKSFLVYERTKEGTHSNTLSFTKYIRLSVPVNIYYEPWQPYVDLDYNLPNCENFRFPSILHLIYCFYKKGTSAYIV